MSGIYIPGMEMPQSCRSCFVRVRAWGAFPACDVAENYEVGRDLVLDGYTYKKVPDGCPLIPVPDHGRLIEADALIEEIAPILEKRGLNAAITLAYAAPTIIPADKEDGE